MLSPFFEIGFEKYPNVCGSSTLFFSLLFATFPYFMAFYLVYSYNI